MSVASIRAAFLREVAVLRTAATTGEQWAAIARILEEVSRSGVRSVSVMGSRLDVSDPVVSMALRRRELWLQSYLVRTMWEGRSLARSIAISRRRSPEDEEAFTVGLSAREVQALANYRAELERGDAALSRARLLRDRRFDRLTSPSSRQIDRMVTRYRDRLLVYRARRVARTEHTRSVSLAQMLGWQQAIRRGRIGAREVRRFWVYVDDLRTRHTHREIPGLNPEGRFLDEPFESSLGPISYPGDPDADARNVVNCRCRLEFRRTQ